MEAEFRVATAPQWIPSIAEEGCEWAAGALFTADDTGAVVVRNLQDGSSLRQRCERLDCLLGFHVGDQLDGTGGEVSGEQADISRQARAD